MQQNFPWRTLCLASALALVSACNNGSSGGSNASALVIDEVEPNDDSATANALVVGEVGGGMVADSTDTDFWSLDLAAGEFITIEAFAQRLDQGTWTTATNSTRITVYDTDGTTILLQQDDELFQWNDNQDTDVSLFRAPAAGTYFVGIDVADGLVTGGDYLVSVANTSVPTPLQFEQELEGVSGTNDTDATAEAIVPGTVYGFHVDEESDFYSFEVTEPSRVTFTMHGHRMGVWKEDSYYDPELVMYDTAVSPLEDNDDTFYLDSSIQQVVSTTGTYFVEVTECCADGDSGYFLEFELEALADLATAVEVEPNDDTAGAQAVQFGDYVTGNVAVGNDDVYSITCNAGDRISVKVFDVDNLEGAIDEVSIDILDSLAASVPFESDSSGLKVQRTILTATDTFFVQVSAVTNATDYALVITQEGATHETEPNDALAEAGTFTAGKTSGVIDTAGDVDMFAFQGTAGQPLFFNAIASNGFGPNGFFELDGFGSSMGPVLTVTDALATVLATSDASEGNAVGIVRGLSSNGLMFVPAATGTFYLTVEDTNATGGSDFYYVITME